MRRLKLLFSFGAVFLSLLPQAAVFAGSCRCDQYHPSRGTRTGTCPYNSTVRQISSQAECSALNNSRDTVSNFTYTNCIYCSDNDCSVDCGVTPPPAGYTKTDSSCTPDTVDRCLTDGSVGKAVCYQEYCWLDSEALALRNSRAGLMGLGESIKIKKPLLEINIPGVEFSDLTDNIDQQGNIHIPYLGQYLAGIYKFALAVSSMIAVIVIILNGFRIVVSAGGEEKGNGIKKVGQALTGLSILWGSYAFFYTINPELVQFRPLGIRYLKGVDNQIIQSSIQAADTIKNTVKTCSGYSDSALTAAVIHPSALAAAQSYGLDPLILASIFEQENGKNNINPRRGPCGEVGVTQLMPSTAEGLGFPCCTASNSRRQIDRGVCDELQTSDVIGTDGPGEPYTYTCNTKICGHCEQAAGDCVDYFHGPNALANAMEYAAKLIVMDIYKYTNKDVALTFAGYNGGQRPNAAALEYARQALEIYKRKCGEVRGSL